MRRARTLLATSLFLLALSPARAVETGTLIKADTLRAEPFGDAKAVVTLATGVKVDILQKNGGWLQVKSAKGKGWVRMLSVRRATAAKPSGATGVLALASGRAGTGKVVATTGIRGLNEEELKTASYNEAELKLAESYATKAADARTFAKQGKLTARSVGYLPNPQ